MSSSNVLTELTKLGEKVSLVTVKRSLSELLRNGLVHSSGEARATTYTISTKGRIHTAIDTKAYCSVEPDRRYGLENFNFEILPALEDEIFTSEELHTLTEATKEYHHRSKDISPTLQKKRTREADY